MNIYLLCKTFLYESLLVTYTPLKKISESKLKFIDNSWVTSGLQKFVSIENHYLSKFIRVKRPSKKKEVYNEFHVKVPL